MHGNKRGLHALQGENAAVLFYGAQGTGKSYSLEVRHTACTSMWGHCARESRSRRQCCRQRRSLPVCAHLGCSAVGCQRLLAAKRWDVKHACSCVPSYQ